ncbi:MAG: hypothetical protein F6K30_19355, partial [Cyanothece sp. SIO2G6]|nr:hypothetical protein [Cyanothece sp. SIO2G6]
MTTELDTEQQARLSFLEEAKTYFDEVEKVILNLNGSDQRLQQLDIAMRATHSVKGAAGMMGFLPLSQVAHNMEDCFKILRARDLQLEPEVETLLLQGLDCLRQVRQHHTEQEPLEGSWLEIHIGMVFEKLREHLGELTEADENQLLSDEEKVDTKILAFTIEVESRLDKLEQRLPTLQGKALLKAIALEAKHLLQLGKTAEIEAFVALCLSVLKQCRRISAVTLPMLATQSLQDWQRSLSLIQLGRMDQLPRAIALASNPPPQAKATPAKPLPSAATAKTQPSAATSNTAISNTAISSTVANRTRLDHEGKTSSPKISSPKISSPKSSSPKSSSLKPSSPNKYQSSKPSSSKPSSSKPPSPNTHQSPHSVPPPPPPPPPPNPPTP